MFRNTGANAFAKNQMRLAYEDKRDLYCNCDTNARIKFIFNIAIDDLEWKNPIDFGDCRKNQNGRLRPFCENMFKKLVYSIT